MRGDQNQETLSSIHLCFTAGGGGFLPHISMYQPVNWVQYQHRAYFLGSHETHTGSDTGHNFKCTNWGSKERYP